MDETLYPFNQELIEEMSRLNKQASVLNARISLPDAVEQNCDHPYQALDLACGPGSWSMGVAKRFPHWHVTGIDISKRMIDYAQVQASADRIENAMFLVGNAVQPLPFEDDTLDFIHARMVQGFVKIDGWERLFAECHRVLKSGGLLQITESERPACNKTSSTRLYSLIAQSGTHFGVSGSPDGQLFGVCHLLSMFLEEAGFAIEAETPYVVNYSARRDIHQIWCEDVLAAFKQLPAILSLIGIPAPETEKLLDKAGQEMAAPDFRAIMFFLSVVGRKPI